MKNIWTIVLFVLFVQVTRAQKVDTIYYDANWKGVAKKDQAAFMRIVNASSDSPSMTVYDFYITGEQQTEGVIAEYIDKDDDTKSKFKGPGKFYYKSGKKQGEYFRNDSCNLEGEVNFYYENGNVKSRDLYKNGILQESTVWNQNGVKTKFLKGTLINGKFNGEQTEFYENGLRKNKGILKDGKFIGTCYQFNEDGSYCEIEYKNGLPQRDYIFVGINGKRTKMKLNEP